ncbi:hypothetical protein [Streptomyces viridochromogenes]|uniref:Uncharacterized protein n=1 Tax=Streptomyces viridochromogenes Tue57 TaxID=1160705 RepID=L8PIK9_STRVR|nr:hypothetical protein [Streptomyces viridochromogenes]ELS55868.1 hypothetical protein STVIR_3213 [Streptomyces viridochromogenes Tue57]
MKITADHARLVHALHGLLASCQDLADRHQAVLDRYRDADGYVIDDADTDYQDARITTAIEASDHLDTVIEQLTRLVGQAPPGTFTLTFAGRERHDGERPTSFAIQAASLHEARRVIEQLPGFQQWCQDNAADGAPGSAAPDVVFVRQQSHPGLRPPGEYVDLRPEQAPSAPAATSHSSPANLRPPTITSLPGPRSRPR